MRNVLVIITTKFVSYGGLTNAFMNYYRAMDKNAISIDIASSNEIELVLKKELDSCNSRYFKLPDKYCHIMQYYKSLKKLLLSYQTVHVHGNSSTMTIELLAAARAGVNVRIAHCHTNKCMHPQINGFLTPLFKKLYTKAVAVSEEAGRWIYGNKDFVVLNNAIDTELFKFDQSNRDAVRKQYGLSDNYVYGHVGKIYEAKNHDFLVRCFYRIYQKENKARLLLVGDGKLRNSIENLVKQLKIDNAVIFAGMQKETFRYYSAMDVFLFPSLYEGYPLSVVEAQANGLVVFSSVNVPQACNLTGDVKFLELNETEWEYQINNLNLAALNLKREASSISAKEEICLKGFDSKTNSDRLKRMYMGLD